LPRKREFANFCVVCKMRICLKCLKFQKHKFCHQCSGLFCNKTMRKCINCNKHFCDGCYLDHIVFECK
jgi:hypothetical protein